VPGYLDLWPLAAELLGFGPSFGDRDAGCVKVRVEVLGGEGDAGFQRARVP